MRRGIIDIPVSARRAGSQVAIQLAEGNYVKAHSIVDAFEARLNQPPEPVTTIAELEEYGVDLRTINLLEQEGYVFLNDIKGLDLCKLVTPQLGMASLMIVERAYRKALEDNKNLGVDALSVWRALPR